MCGRYSLAKKLGQLPNGQLAPEVQSPRFNIAPTQQVITIAAINGNDYAYHKMRWGLIPSFTKEETGHTLMINAKVETLHEKPSFKNLLEAKRCLVPADGFYEWRQMGKEKAPHYIYSPDHEVFYIAGLFDTWQSAKSGPLNSCTTITTAARGIMASLHHRMPFLLSLEQGLAYLKAQDPLNYLQDLPLHLLQYHAVSPAVNGVDKDDDSLIKPYIGGTLSLF